MSKARPTASRRAKRHRVPVVLLAGAPEHLQTSLSRALTPHFRVLAASAESEALAHVSAARGIDAFIYFEDEWLDFAVRHLRLGVGRARPVAIVTCSFVPLEGLRKQTREHYGTDLLNIPGWYFVSLPFTVEDFVKTLQQAVRGLQVEARVVVDAFLVVRRHLGRLAWSEMEHFARNAAGRGLDGWRDLCTVGIPRFLEEMAHLDHPRQKLYLTERRALAKIKRIALPSFERLRDVAIQVLPLQSDTGWTDGKTWAATVLVVEDDVDFANSLRIMLEGVGHKVSVVASPRVGVRTIVKEVAQRDVDVVLLDLNFGTVGQGWRILSTIRERRPDTKVIMLTGHGGPEFMVEAKRRGASAYLRKPCDAGTLVESIRQALMKRRVLFVDDELETILTADVQTRFVHARCEVMGYTSPEAMLAAVDDGAVNLTHIDLVLLDLNFGGRMAGVPAFRELKHRRLDLPIFILTGYGDDDTVQRVIYQDLVDCFGVKARDHYLVKPLDDSRWAKIWAMLFPQARTLLLKSLRVEGRKERGGVQLHDAAGERICEVWVEPKQWALLYGLALKRQRGRPAIEIKVWQFAQDEEMKEALRYLDTLPEFGDPNYVREAISRVNTAVEHALGRPWELISRVGRGRYEIAPEILEIVFEAR